MNDGFDWSVKKANFLKVEKTSFKNLPRIPVMKMIWSYCMHMHIASFKLVAEKISPEFYKGFSYIYSSLAYSLIYC